MIDNPIFSQYRTPYGAYPFNDIKEEHYREAFERAIASKRAEINAIIEDPEELTFENTILALERCGSMLERVTGIFFNLLHANTTDELMKISEEVMPKLSELSSFVILSEPLFKRIKHVYDNKDSFALDQEELRLLQNCYEGFCESGALLPSEGKKRLEELSLTLSQSSLLYGQNVLKDQKRYKLHLTAPCDVEGMPASALLVASEAAQREGHKEGWVFDLSAPSYFAFMQHCPKSELRQQMYMAKMRVGAAGDEFDNKEHIKVLVNGRLEEARLLGHSTFADAVLHKRMAKSPDAVYELLNSLLGAYKPIAKSEIEQIRQFASEQGSDGDLMSWDWSYWAEQYKQRHYELDDEMLRPYFELSRVSAAVFGLATTLYGIKFVKRTDIPTYHPDVETYEVLDRDGSYLGLLYTDFFPRDGKQSGAWMNTLQDQYRHADGTDHRPHIILVMNFTPPTADTPSLLTVGEVNTFLHEFGHALHGLFSDCKFSSLSGTSVARDFVELPSQLMENWLGEEEWLRSFAYHYKTGEPIPSDYIERMKRAKHYLVGYATCRQISFGLLDMAWHSLQEPVGEGFDIKSFEEEAWSEALVLPPSPRETMMSTSFSHIFSGGYSAGYYGYKWAEVLDADAFSLFKEQGIFSREVAERFRKDVLSQGDKRDAIDLYVAFRGQKPAINALLERDGITPASVQ